MEREATKYEAFVAALRDLCLHHGVQLAPSGYDSIDVWDLRDGEDPIYMDCIADRTETPNANVTGLAPAQETMK